MRSLLYRLKQVFCRHDYAEEKIIAADGYKVFVNQDKFLRVCLECNHITVRYQVIKNEM